MRRLRTHILSGRWAPGADLPPRTELVYELGIGYPTLNHALQQLEDQGLVTRDGPGRAYRVAGDDNPLHALTNRERAIGYIEAAIVQQRWERREPLPTTTQLGREIGVSPTTVHTALNILRDQQLLTGGGRGHQFTVADTIDEHVMSPAARLFMRRRAENRLVATGERNGI
jgi:DNA-binding GntR family transcriptional regulator